VPWVREKPSSYVRGHVRATTGPAQLPPDPSARAALLDMVGTDMLMFASDHPHDHGGGGAAFLEALDPSTREAITRSNAAGFYGFRTAASTSGPR
jgi:predicted TIM-barrel fold metal-dependent hydrolase